MKNKVLLFGYAGFKNFGDDLLLKLAVDNIKKAGKEVDLSIMTTNLEGVKYLTKWFPDCHIIYRYKLDWKLFSSFSKVLLFGGGVYFNSSTEYSLLKYLRKRLSVLKNYGVPYLLGTRFASVGIGIGPFRTSKAERAVLPILQFQDLLVVRDKVSLGYASEYGAKYISMAPDLSLIEYNDLKQLKEERDSNKVLIVIRNYKYNDNKNSYIDVVIEFADYLKSKGKQVTWCSFQPEYDNPVLEKIADRNEQVWLWEPETMCPQSLYALFSEMEFVLTARMHGVFIAGLMGMSVVGIAIDPKIELAAKNFDENVQAINPNASLKELIEVYYTTISCSKRDAYDIEVAVSHVAGVYKKINDWIE